MRLHRAVAIVALIAIVTVAGFGLLVMAHGDNHVAGCFATAAAQAACPVSGPFASIAFHVDVWQQVLVAVFAMILVARIAWGVWVYRLRVVAVPIGVPWGSVAARVFVARASPLPRAFHRWLA